jgi:hypothetical protein
MVFLPPLCVMVVCSPCDLTLRVCNQYNLDTLFDDPPTPLGTKSKRSTTIRRRMIKTDLDSTFDNQPSPRGSLQAGRGEVQRWPKGFSFGLLNVSVGWCNTTHPKLLIWLNSARETSLYTCSTFLTLSSSLRIKRVNLEVLHSVAHNIYVADVQDYPSTGTCSNVYMAQLRT